MIFDKKTKEEKRQNKIDKQNKTLKELAVFTGILAIGGVFND